MQLPLLWACFWRFISPAAADALADIQKAKVIKVAVPQDFAPFGSAGIDMKPVGYDIDMANYIAGELGVKAEIVPVTSANRVPYLQTKKVDLVISSLGKNAEREKVIDFTVAYAPFFSGVYGLKGDATAKVEDLASKTVGATRGSIEEQELTKTAPVLDHGQALRGQQRDHFGVHLRPGRSDRYRQYGCGLHRREEPGAQAGAEICRQEQPLLCRPEQGRARAARQGQRDHRQGQDRRHAGQILREMAEGAASGRVLGGIRMRGWRRVLRAGIPSPSYLRHLLPSVIPAKAGTQ